MTATSPQALLLQGAAALVAATGHAVYRDSGIYEPGEAGVTFEGLPPTGSGVALAIYDDVPVDISATRYYLQARIRTSSDPLDLDLVDAVRDALAFARHPTMPGGLRVTTITPVSFARLGPISGQYEFTRNFACLTARAARWAPPLPPTGG